MKNGSNNSLHQFCSPAAGLQPERLVVVRDCVARCGIPFVPLSDLLPIDLSTLPAAQMTLAQQPGREGLIALQQPPQPPESASGSSPSSAGYRG